MYLVSYHSVRKTLTLAIPWLPSFVAMDGLFLDNILCRLQEKYKNPENQIREMHLEVVEAIDKRYGADFEGFREWLEGIEKVVQKKS